MLGSELLSRAPRVSDTSGDAAGPSARAQSTTEASSLSSTVASTLPGEASASPSSAEVLTGVWK
jgi:hypothetical protein